MDFDAYAGGLIEKSLKDAGAGALCWQIQSVVGRPPGCGARVPLIVLFWAVVPPHWFWAVRTILLSGYVPTQTEIAGLVRGAITDMDEQSRAWRP